MLDFTLSLPCQSDELMKLITDYENFKNFFPDQIKSVKVLDSNSQGTTTEEIMKFSTYFDHEIIQQSLHKQISANQLETTVISGPMKGSLVQMTLDKIDSGTKVTVKADVKISLKYKILEPIIKKKYKLLLTALLYKMNNYLTSHR